MGPETFRSHAAECRRLAKRADDDEYKSLLLSMAQTWVVLPHLAWAITEPVAEPA